MPAPLVLIVDDVDDAQELYGDLLGFAGYRTIAARDGAAAIEAAMRERPDLILMDVQMPVLDGWEATRRLKADARTRAIPIVVLTGHALAVHEERARQAGCDAFLAKPCPPDELLRMVARFVTPTTRP